jgi:hypothetical protein
VLQGSLGPIYEYGPAATEGRADSNIAREGSARAPRSDVSTYAASTGSAIAVAVTEESQAS